MCPKLEHTRSYTAPLSWREVAIPLKHKNRSGVVNHEAGSRVKNALLFYALFVLLVCSILELPLRADDYPFLKSALFESGAELFGTYILILIGNGCASSMGSRATLSVLEAGIMWGIGVLCAILVAGTVSGAHLNPAVTLAMAFARKFSFKRVPHYILSQCLGAFLASVTVHLLYPAFTTSVPHPHEWPKYWCQLSQVNSVQGFGIEVLITAVLLIVICAVSDPLGAAASAGPVAAPTVIASVVAVLIGCFGNFTAACLNPARDLGPRLAGVLIQDAESDHSHTWIFVLAPIVGAIIGTFIWEYGYTPLLRYGNDIKQWEEQDGISNKTRPNV